MWFLLLIISFNNRRIKTKNITAVLALKIKHHGKNESEEMSVWIKTGSLLGMGTNQMTNWSSSHILASSQRTARNFLEFWCNLCQCMAVYAESRGWSPCFLLFRITLPAAQESPPKKRTCGHSSAVWLKWLWALLNPHILLPTRNEREKEAGLWARMNQSEFPNIPPGSERPIFMFQSMVQP